MIKKKIRIKNIKIEVEAEVGVDIIEEEKDIEEVEELRLNYKILYNQNCH